MPDNFQEKPTEPVASLTAFSVVTDENLCVTLFPILAFKKEYLNVTFTLPTFNKTVKIQHFPSQERLGSSSMKHSNIIDLTQGAINI